MKKIGIATITATKNNIYNYGNVLQNYALTFFLKKNEFDVSTIYYESKIPSYTLNQIKTNKKNNSLSQFLDDLYRVIKRNLNKKKIQKLTESRNEKFKTFINSNIHYTETYKYDSDFSVLEQSYNAFIVGSDQVWNPYYEGSNPFYYLPFAQKKKKIAYAPSIGVDHIPIDFYNEMKSLIKNINYLSIREQEGKEILEKEFDICIELVVDPVFLLSKEEWDLIATPINNKNKYFVVYILGKKTIQTKKQINLLKKKYKMKVVDLYTRDNPDSLFCGPQEFISLIKNAEFVVTDSFHGSAFSVIYSKPLIIIDRNASQKESKYKMNGRIDGLLNLLSAGNRTIKFLLQNESLLMKPIDIKKTSLNLLIEKSKAFLLNALFS